MSPIGHYEMFPGAPVIKGAYAYMDDKPGIGVEFNEVLAEKHPAENYKTDRLEMRRPDGSMRLPQDPFALVGFCVFFL
jgi:mannonate dehydratase